MQKIHLMKTGLNKYYIVRLTNLLLDNGYSTEYLNTETLKWQPEESAEIFESSEESILAIWGIYKKVNSRTVIRELSE